MEKILPYDIICYTIHKCCLFDNKTDYNEFISGIKIATCEIYCDETAGTSGPKQKYYTFLYWRNVFLINSKTYFKITIIQYTLLIMVFYKTAFR